jgi:hypothetical protein
MDDLKMNFTYRAAVGLFTLTACALLHAEPDMVIFGEINFGRPLSIPECQKERGYAPAFNKTKDTCITLSPNGAFVRVLFPSDENMIASGSQVVVWPAAGNVEAVQFMTGGPNSDAEVMETLRKKYGRPTTEQHESMQNGFGATFDRHSAAWVLNGLSVSYTSIFDNATRGKVVIKTPEGGRIIEAFDSKTSGAKRAM